MRLPEPVSACRRFILVRMTFDYSCDVGPASPGASAPQWPFRVPRSLDGWLAYGPASSRRPHARKPAESLPGTQTLPSVECTRYRQSRADPSASTSHAVPGSDRSPNHGWNPWSSRFVWLYSEQAILSHDARHSFVIHVHSSSRQLCRHPPQLKQACRIYRTDAIGIVTLPPKDSQSWLRDRFRGTLRSGI